MPVFGVILVRIFPPAFGLNTDQNNSEDGRSEQDPFKKYLNLNGNIVL